MTSVTLCGFTFIKYHEQLGRGVSHETKAVELPFGIFDTTTELLRQTHAEKKIIWKEVTTAN